MDLAPAQSTNEFQAEDFLAEVFYGYMTKKSPKVYLEKRTYYPFFVSNYKAPNPNNADDVFEAEISEEYWLEQTWNEKAPVFQQPKYKNLIFVDDISKLPKRKRKKAEKRISTKPIFTKSGQYALIGTEDRIRNKLSWAYRRANVPKKDFWKVKYQLTISFYLDLYQRIDGKWVRIDHKYTHHSE
jgi:hypothetical protein